MKRRKIPARVLWGLLALALLVLLAAGRLALAAAGLWHFTSPGKEYPVWGVDVSEYQGRVDWQALQGQGVRFAFIRATEGSGWQDEQFAANWQGARQAGIPAGAYHFFSFDSPADTQADNFLAALDGQPGQLPPVVDIELYGDYKQSPPDAERVLPQLEELLDRLEQADGRKPILYTTRAAYRLYLQDRLPEYQVWIRDILKKPRLEDGRDWLFWQYTGRGLLDGYAGEEKFIDLNVFGGGEEDWQSYLESCRAAG